ncbi:hypothetical protein CKO28_10855 [Rhodovibrio sodomensis]|uniref:DUF2380 domain-containing protein n=1 Tax=Rhodovibrio sodomensis TaxID=1088 RepID=A0ABS1DEX2_9PROT|nr:DUF3280 domain-containing protein [Rhodovibrio sodomensis]MBK1668531.1 hypothetical protein [Rhodovibrio sodomensis]
MRLFLIACAIFFAATARAAWADDTASTGTATVVFGFELQDTSGEPHTDALDRRLQAATEVLRQGLDARARYAVVSLDGHADAIAQAGYLAGCNGCELAIARKAGGQYSVRGLVHKVSTLILYIEVSVTDVESERVVCHGRVSIRGDTEQAYRRGVRFLIKQHLSAPPEAKTC